MKGTTELKMRVKTDPTPLPRIKAPPSSVNEAGKGFKPLPRIK